jgi:hypothetical protein
MPILELFSKRQRRARGDVPDVFQYTDLPLAFRTQVAHIFADLFGDPHAYESPTDRAFKSIHDLLCREYGEFSLWPKSDPRKVHYSSWQGTVTNFLLNTEVEKALDTIEIGLKVAHWCHEDYGFRRSAKPTMELDAAIQELNQRFREHGIGYQFEASEIIRVDSQILHAEAVKPALQLLADSKFSAANGEFLKAHEHYRHARYGESMNESLKAFESCLKVICKQRQFPHRETDTASTLINAVFTGGLIPAWLQSEFAGLRATLEAGVPTARNKLSGHGAGAQPKEIPASMAAYLLHMTASAVVFLVQTHRDTP